MTSLILGSQLTPDQDDLVSQQIDVLRTSTALYEAAESVSEEAAREGIRLKGDEAIHLAVENLVESREMDEYSIVAVWAIANLTRKVLKDCPPVVEALAVFKGE